MKDKPKETNPSTVSNATKQGGEARARWAWTEPAVWTERMLIALENGVKGNVWFSLMDKVYAPKNLQAAWEHVEKNDGAAGVDRQTVEDFSAQAESSLRWLHEQLRTGTYRPNEVRRVWIPKLGTTQQRPLGIPTIRDRIVQGALRNVIEPIFEQGFDEHSYGFRPGRGCKDALRRVDWLLKEGFMHVVDADIQSYFDRIPHDRLLDEVRRKIADGRVLDLIQAFLEQQVMDGLERWTPEQGTPQGAVISPLLANLYLHPVDIALREAGFEGVRYADDLVILCRSEAKAQEALALLTAQIQQRGLTLHPEKTRLVDMSQPGGFDFLGYHFERGEKTPRQKSIQKIRSRVREITPRNRGTTLKQIVTDLNAVLHGWFEYFKHGGREALARIDSFTRRRLRAILLRRTQPRRRGIGTGFAHKEWPNAYFAKQGLFSLATAHAEACQSR